MSTFGEKLKQYRLAMDMSQENLADILDTTKQVISRYESGLRVPKLTTAQQYAEKLNLPLPYLIDDEITFKIWDHESYIDDYWNDSEKGRIYIVSKLGIDPRIAADYSTLNKQNFVLNGTSFSDLSEDDLSIARAYHIASADERAVVELTLKKYMAKPTFSGMEKSS